MKALENDIRYRTSILSTCDIYGPLVERVHAQPSICAQILANKTLHEPQTAIPQPGRCTNIQQQGGDLRSKHNMSSGAQLASIIYSLVTYSLAWSSEY